MLGINKKYSRLGHLQWRSVLPLELTVHKDPVLAVAFEKEVLLLVVDLHMGSADEAGVPQVNVHLSLSGTVPSDHHLALSHQILKLLTRYLGNGRFRYLVIPVHWSWRSNGGVFKGQKSPGIRLSIVFNVLLRTWSQCGHVE